MPANGETKTMTALNKLRFASWKGNLSGVVAAVESITESGDMDDLINAWNDLVESADNYTEDKSADSRDALVGDLDAFDSALRLIFGPHQWELELNAETSESSESEEVDA
jgi:hypothetical protein